jgi:hypothetical protein
VRRSGGSEKREDARLSSAQLANSHQSGTFSVCPVQLSPTTRLSHEPSAFQQDCEIASQPTRIDAGEVLKDR